MTQSEQTEMQQKEIGLTEIISFIKKYYKRLVAFAVISGFITLFLIAAFYFFLPKNEVFVSKISVQLQNKNGKLVYPSEKTFSANDIISSPVLQRVYAKNNLKNKLTFSEFSELFSLSGINMKKALLSVAYKNKLTKKNITIIDIKALEQEYQDALRSLEDNSVEISMIPTGKLNSQESAKLLREIPLEWFNIYSRHEAKIMPRIATTTQIQELRKSPINEGWLITLDKTRLACQNLQRGCSELNAMLMGQKVSLPSGEYLADLQNRLNILEKHRIRPTLLLVRETPGYKNPMDRLFLRSTIMLLERRIEVLKEKYEATVSAINILHPADNTSASKQQLPPARSANAAPMTLNLDGNFFTSIITLIRNSETIALREKYAEAALVLKGEIAELESEKRYYNAIYQDLLEVQPGKNTLTTAQFHGLTKAMFDELLELSGKVNEFKEIILKNYLSNRNFFATSGEIQKSASFVFPFKKIALGLIFLLVLVNVVNVSIKFYSAYTQKEL